MTKPEDVTFRVDPGKGRYPARDVIVMVKLHERNPRNNNYMQKQADLQQIRDTILSHHKRLTGTDPDTTTLTAEANARDVDIGVALEAVHPKILIRSTADVWKKTPEAFGYGMHYDRHGRQHICAKCTDQQRKGEPLPGEREAAKVGPPRAICGFHPGQALEAVNYCDQCGVTKGSSGDIVDIHVMEYGTDLKSSCLLCLPTFGRKGYTHTCTRGCGVPTLDPKWEEFVESNGASYFQ